MTDEVVTLEEALIIAKEIGDSLGGRQQHALQVLARYAERSRKSSTTMQATTHFKNATEIMKKGEGDGE